MKAIEKFTINFFFFFIIACEIAWRTKHPIHPIPITMVVAPLDDSMAVNAFYARNLQKLFWFLPGSGSSQLRRALKQSIDSSIYFGLTKENYHYDIVSKFCEPANTYYKDSNLTNADRVFTDAAIKFCSDVYKGANISKWINSDEISNKYQDKDIDFILSGLLQSSDATKYKEFVSRLQPKDIDYRVLRSLIADSIGSDSKNIKGLTASINLTRWINHFRLNKYVVVNIGSATLRYYENDSLKLKMKVVVGKPSTRTPRFAAYCNEIILYPYWNVPRKIVLNELLPTFKSLPNSVESMNMQIIDRYGRIVDLDTLNWRLYNHNFFPYEVRQSTGCDNALGVIKFNLTSPFDVYMHDTNLKSAFKSE
ncbi:MAG: hypothetical protein C5B59_05545 [Bacteroidetes bacterium]|nr:MAG: hypothetical protein C5B59_05545 [Bacteroidota bacterium]